MKHIEIENIETKVGMVKLVTLRSNRLTVVLTSFGAGIFSMVYDGKEILTRPEKIEDYLLSKAYYGKTIGRHSGRLFGPQYQIDGKMYDVLLDKGEPFQLHSGEYNFAFKQFTLTGYERMGDRTNVTFSYLSKADSDGFPGNLKLDVTYEVTKEDALKISYHATTSAPTLCHLTNHLYLNVGDQPDNILDQLLYVDSDYYLDVDKDYRLKSVKKVIDSPFDFRLPKRIGERINEVMQPDLIGYDYCFLLNKHDDLEPILSLTNQQTNLSVDVFTNYPSIVLYTHNHPLVVPLHQVSTNGVHSGLAVECQYPPDGIHHDGLDSGVLMPGEVERKFIIIKPYIKK